jgi:hypothetical protein
MYLQMNTLGMHFIYGFCDGNGMAAVVEYWQQYPLCRTFENIYRTEGDWFLPMSDCRT